ncbi:retrovirus-related Pol polyprotein from transposon opus [Trichonephila clavipes]|nr:retrovirus-related Pol polyprotein from transposon opus [Trichonephila clavipes]
MESMDPVVITVDLIATVPDHDPVPHIQDCTQNLYGKTIHYFGFGPSVSSNSNKSTPFGLFEYTAMPFWTSKFRSNISDTFAHLEFCIPYFDDLLIASSSKDEHLDYLRQIFSR